MSAAIELTQPKFAEAGGVPQQSGRKSAATTSKVRLSLELSADMNRRLDELAERTGSAKSDILRYGIALMELVVDARQNGRKVGVVNSDQALALELVLPF